jgi:uncharacterized protein YbjT (DUF2867 family)
MSATRTYTVFGPTGAQGAPVVARLLAAGHRVRAVARDTGKIRAKWSDRVEAVAVDLADAPSVAKALSGVDGAFLHLPLALSAEQAQANAAGLIGGLAQSDLPLAVWTISGYGLEALPDISFVAAGRHITAGLQATGKPLITLRPTIYTENLRWPHVWARIKDEGIFDYPPVRSDRPLSWTDLDDQAAIAVAALSRPDLAGTSTDIATPGALTGQELAAVFGRLLNREVRHAPLTPRAFGDGLAAAFQSPALGDFIADLYSALDALPLTGTIVDTDLVQRRFGVTLPSLKERLAGW